MKLLARLAPLAAFTPFLALAQAPNLSFFTSLIGQIESLINLAIPVVFALAMLFFFWGVFVYFIYGAGDEEKRETGKKYMIYSIIGLVLLVAVWGIVQLIISILGTGTGGGYSIPGTPS